MPAQDFTKYEHIGAYHWSAAFPTSVRRFDPRTQARYTLPLREILRRVDRGPRPVGLDAGCGDGVWTFMASTAGLRVIGLDGSLQALLLARREIVARQGSRPTLIRGSCTEIPLASASLDFIALIEVIEHLDDPDSFLTEAVRVLRPGGIVVLTTPHRRPDGRVQDPFHVREYTGSELRELLGRYLRDVDVRGVCSPLLDRLYYSATGWSSLDKLVRGCIKLFSKFVTNPYVWMTTTEPTFGWATLLGVGVVR